MSEALRSIRGNAATTLAATVTVLIVTFLMGIFVALGWWVHHYAVSKQNEVTVKLYLPEAYVKDATKRGLMANQIRTLPYFQTAEYVSPAQAKARASAAVRASINALGFNPLPPAFYVKLTDPSKASALAAAALKIPDIKNCGTPGKCVIWGKKITDRVLTTLKYVLLFVGGLALLLGIAAVVLIQNTIRLSIFARRREIEVMKLVGATNSFVRLPFMLEGMLTGLLGAAGAVVLLGVVYVALNALSHGLTDPVRLVGVPTLIALLGGFGLILGAAGSGLTLRRFLRV
jgi:cell division transport system permease protein